MSNSKLYRYLFVAGYFTYLLILIKFSLDEVNQTYIIIGLSPLWVYALLKYFYKRALRKQAIAASIAMIGFYLFYYLLSSYNQLVFFRGITLFIIMLCHIIVLCYYIFKNPFLQDIKYSTFGFLLLTVFVVFIPHYLVAKSLAFGAFYNLLDSSFLTKTTVEGPLIVAVLFLLSFFDLIFNKKYTKLNFFSLAFSVFVLLVFNRRGFIFSSILSVMLYYLINRFNIPRICYLIFAVLFLPMYWSTISDLLVDVSNNPLFSSVIVRNNSQEMVTANGRSIGWHNILKLYYSRDSQYMFGYFGRIPEWVFLSAKENGRYQHAHNTLLQLFLDAGYFINIYFVVMVSAFFNTFAKQKLKNKSSHNFYFVIVIFVFVLASTETLIRQIQFSNFIVCYALLGLYFTSLIQKKSKTFALVVSTLDEPTVKVDDDIKSTNGLSQ